MLSTRKRKVYSAGKASGAASGRFCSEEDIGMEATDEKMQHAVRVAKFEVDSVVGQDWKDVVPRWFATVRYARRAANLFYETWLAWHINNQSSVKLEDWLEQRKLVGPKAAGKCPVECMPKELSKVIYKSISERYPFLQIDVVTLLQNTLGLTLTSGKAVKGSLPKWSSILLHNEGMPMFCRSYLVPFSKKNGTLIASEDARCISLKTWRVPVEGQSKKLAVVDIIKLRMTGKSAKGHLKIFDKIASGEWDFRGSQFGYDDVKKKWFVFLCYRMPSKVVQLDQTRTAYLVPGRNNAFYIRTRGNRSQWLQGRGHHINAMRDRVWNKRSELNAGSRKTTSLRGGHGRSAAMKWQERWSRRWREYVKRVNHHVSKDAINYCVANGIGNLIYFKPNGQCAVNRMVSGGNKNATWEFHDLGSKLSYKSQDRGVILTVVECGKEPEAKEPVAESKSKRTKK